jgi:predicted ATP-grasp superfamily ATP-dependent carboligase
MAADELVLYSKPHLENGSLVLAFTGWMNGGDVSTGTIEWLVDAVEAREAGEIEPESFYIYNFPGSMELSALFRPHVRIENGRIIEFDLPENILYCSEDSGLAFFSGKEPNFNWSEFSDCLFTFAEQAGISTIYFVGSYAGVVPHTRDPRMTSTVSDDDMKDFIQQYGLKPTEYEGPASFSTYLLEESARRGLHMATLVAEIPAYIEGPNPKCIQAVVKKLTAILDLQVNMDQLQGLTEVWERKLNEALEEKPEMHEHIQKLEQDYDNEVFDTQMGDLKEWLQRQGIRVD